MGIAPGGAGYEWRRGSAGDITPAMKLLERIPETTSAPHQYLHARPPQGCVAADVGVDTVSGLVESRIPPGSSPSRLHTSWLCNTSSLRVKSEKQNVTYEQLHNLGAVHTA